MQQSPDENIASMPIISEDEYASYNFTLRQGRDFTFYYKKGLEKTK